MRKEYWINGTQLASAREAMAAHKAGKDVVAWYHNSHTITIKGVAPEKKNNLDENTRHCKSIAESVNAWAAGDVRKCPECGETIRRDEWPDVFKCPECGHVNDVDAFETQTIWDYLDDVYNVEFRVSGRSRDDLRSVQIMVACGGPNIYLDTASRDVELYWWTEKARWPLSYAAVEALDEWAEEYWGCM